MPYTRTILQINTTQCSLLTWKPSQPLKPTQRCQFKPCSKTHTAHEICNYFLTFQGQYSANDIMSWWMQVQSWYKCRPMKTCLQNTPPSLTGLQIVCLNRRSELRSADYLTSAPLNLNSWEKTITQYLWWTLSQYTMEISKIGRRDGKKKEEGVGEKESKQQPHRNQCRDVWETHPQERPQQSQRGLLRAQFWSVCTLECETILWSTVELAILSLCSKSQVHNGTTGTPDTAQSSHTFTSSKRSFPGSSQMDSPNTPKALFRRKIGTSRPKQISPQHLLLAFQISLLASTRQQFPACSLSRRRWCPVHHCNNKDHCTHSWRERAACQGSWAPSKTTNTGRGRPAWAAQHSML